MRKRRFSGQCIEYEEFFVVLKSDGLTSKVVGSVSRPACGYKVYTRSFEVRLD